MTTPVTIADLFAGAGGSSLGWLAAGLDVIGAYERWPVAAENYAANVRNHVHRADIADTAEIVCHVRSRAPRRPMILAGSPPCQDFSAVSRHGDKWRTMERADLTTSFFQVAANAYTPVILMENVPRAQSAAVYQHGVNRLRDNGYLVIDMILDASFFGVPQRRKRLFMLAVHKLYSAKSGIRKFTEALEAYRTPKPLTVGEYLGDDIKTEHYYYRPPSKPGNNQSVFSLDVPAPTIRGANETTREGSNGWPQHPSDVVHITESYPLSLYQLSRIQTFPKSYEWSGAKSNVVQMIGNAVPPELARRIGLALRFMMTGEPEPVLTLPESGQVSLFNQ